MKGFHWIFVVALWAGACFSHAAWIPAADSEGNVYVGNEYGVRAYSPAGLLWSKSTPRVIGNVTVNSNSVFSTYAYFVSGNPGPSYYAIGMYAFNKADGATKWTISGGYDRLPPSVRLGAALDAKGNVFFNGMTLDPDTGSVVATNAVFIESANGIAPPPILQGYASEHAIGGDGTYYEVLGDLVYARDHIDGSVKWTSRIFEGGAEPIIADDGTVLVSDKTGSLYALDHLTGKMIWRRQWFTSQPSFAVALESNRVAVLMDGLVILDAATGTVIPSDINRGVSPDDTPFIVMPDGSLVFNVASAPSWSPGKFKYGKSTWPRRSARNDNVPSLARLGPPRILADPQPAIVTNGTARFWVYAQGTFPLSYQWLRNGAEVAGATNVSFIASNPGLTEDFQVRVANAEGTVLSKPARIGFSLKTLVDGGNIFVSPKLPAYPLGTAITLTAKSWANRDFLGWLGSLASTSNPVTVTVRDNLNLTATFAHRRFDLLWEHLLGGYGYAPPIVSPEGRLYVPTANQIVAMDPAKRAELWRVPAVVEQAAVSPNGNLIIKGRFSVTAYDGVSGQARWTNVIGGSQIAIDPRGNVIVFSFDVVAFSPQGQEIWRAGNLYGRGFIAPNGMIIVQDESTWITALDGNDGRHLWRIRGSSAFLGPYNQLMVGDSSGTYNPFFRTLNFIDMETGKVRSWLPYPSELQFSDVRVTEMGQIFLTPGYNMGQNFYGIRELELDEGRVMPIFPLGSGRPLLTAASNSLLLVSYPNGPLVVDLSSRSLISADASAIPAQFSPSRAQITILPSGKVATMAGSSILQIFNNDEKLAETVRPSDDLNPQGTYCLFRLGPPFIYTQPQDKEFVSGQSRTFAVDATGTQPLSYQWYRDGRAIQFADRADFTISTVTEADRHAEFFVEIKNSEGTIRSRRAGLGFRVTLLTEGLGTIAPAFAPRIVRPGTPLAFRADAVTRPFLGWEGSVVSTNESITVRADSNLVLRAAFEALPGDLLWRLPVRSEVDLQQTSVPLHASVSFPELFLPGFVRVNLLDRSQYPVIDSTNGVWYGNTARVDENVFSWSGTGRTNVFLRFAFGSGLVRTSAFHLVVSLPVADANTNMYAMGDAGLFKLDPNGSIVWNTRIPAFYRADSTPRITGEKEGLLWRPTSENPDFVIFSLATGAVLSRTNLEVRNGIPIPGRRMVAEIRTSKGGTHLAAVDLLSLTSVWTNSLPGTKLLVTDDKNLYGAYGLVCRSIDLATGQTVWERGLTNWDFQSIVLGADRKLYAHNERSLVCIDTRDGTILWSVAPPSDVGTGFWHTRFRGDLCLSSDNILYCFTNEGTLVAYRTSGGLSDSSWPEPSGRGHSWAAMPLERPAAVSLTLLRRQSKWWIEFPTQTATTYTLESTDKIETPAWRRVGTATGDGQTRQIEIRADSQSSFLRLRIVR